MIWLRRTDENDAKLLWDWANDTETRKLSFHKEPIKWESHVAWLQKILASDCATLWIAENHAGVPVGQVCYEMDGAEATVSVTVDPAYRRQGICVQLLRLTSRLLFTSKGVRVVHANILTQNEISVRAFMTAGYRFDRAGTLHEQPALHLVLHLEAVETIGITQPTYLPWIGYYDIIDQADWFVLLNNAQFVRQSWHHRNRIKTPTGLQWLTIPVDFHGRFGKPLASIEIREPQFAQKHLRSLEMNYRRARYFDNYFDELAQIYGSCGNRLAELTTRILRWTMKSLGIQTPMVLATPLSPQGSRSAALIDICRKVGARSYLAMLGSAAYLLNDSKDFEEAGIQVSFNNYVHPEYKQLFPPFVPFAGAVDILFNEGPGAMEIIRSGRRKPFAPHEVPKTDDTIASGV